MAHRCAPSIPWAALLLLSVVGILLLVLPAKEVLTAPGHMYGIVLDAGSSHTSMYVYKWPADKQNGTGIVAQHAECHARGGGISSYAGNRGGAAESLRACLDEAVKAVPKSRHHQTPLYLGATAGMRLLRIANATEADRVLWEVETQLRSYPFQFKAAAILSGQHEGAFGWVTVNYLQENFAKYGFVGRWLNPGRETTGALDLGGASTQITFETPEPTENDENLMELQLYGTKYSLYTQSFLCSGQDELLRRLLAQLITTQGATTKVSHPCHPRLSKVTVELGRDVFVSPCTRGSAPAGYDPRARLMVVGTGDHRSCLGNVTKMFSFENCNYSKCSFDGVFQPSVRGSFMAFSAFFYTHRYLRRLTKLPITSPGQMEAAVGLVCNMTIDEMTSRVNESVKYLRKVCTVSNFMQVLLTRGYKFDHLSFPAISFQEKVAGASVGWALGYMLNLSNMVPAESVSVTKALPAGPWTAMILLLVAFILLALGCLLMMHIKRGNNAGIV